MIGLKKIILFLVLSGGIPLTMATDAYAEKCYLVLESAGDYNHQKVSSFATALISQYVKPVLPAPPEGVGSKECQYRVSISESREGISVSVSGENLNALGDSIKVGLEGVRHALLRAIYRAKPEKKESMCETYPTILSEDCGSEPSPPPVEAEEEPPPKIIPPFHNIDDKMAKGRSSKRRARNHVIVGFLPVLHVGILFTRYTTVGIEYQESENEIHEGLYLRRFPRNSFNGLLAVHRNRNKDTDEIKERFVRLGLGNQWTWNTGIVVGVDWIVYSIRVADSDNPTNEESFRFLDLTIGFSF